MKKKERISEILKALNVRYPYEDKCYLNYSQPHELLIATILSAQCTDERVNIVTKALFAKYPTLEAFASADVSEMEMDVRPTGFYRNKAKNIILAARRLLDDFDGVMPSSVEDLTSLAGVGRKTANVVRCHVFRLPSVVVDTHVMRISKRLGLTKNSEPNKIEQDLMKCLPKSHWILYNHQIIAFGREICKAPKAKCQNCFMPHLCPSLSPRT